MMNLTITHTLTKKRYTYDVVDVSPSPVAISLDVRFGRIPSGEYDYTLTENGRVVADGLLKIARSTAIEQVQYGGIKEFVEYGK